MRSQIPELTRERLPRSMRGSRARALLRVELDGLEKLLSLTKDTNPDYPLLLARVGMSYVELAAIEQSEARTEAARDAWAKAHQYFSRTPPSAPPAQPEVLYLSGLMQEQTGDLTGAKQVYAAVAVHERADASLKARAQLGLGLVAEASAPPDAREAQRAYTEAREWLMRLGFQTPEDQVLAERIQARLDALRGHR